MIRKSLADEIRTGIENEEFVPFYQPQIDATSQKVVGLEALVRWKHPERGILSPHLFLDVAEELGLVADIDELILRKALRDLDEFEKVGLAEKKVSVNVSSRRLYDKSLVEKVSKLNFAPGSLSFELLESIFLDDADTELVTRIRQLRELGIGIDLDDFGTGHASIMGLLSLSPDRLKIDHRLVKPIVADISRRRLVSLIVGIGEALDITVVAEGVETQEHVNVAKKLGCRILQGYAIARPMSAADVVTWLLKRNKETKIIAA